MRALSLTLRGAEVLWPAGPGPGNLALDGGRIVTGRGGRVVDLSGFMILPGLIDLHGDGFEHHLAPRRGALSDLGAGLLSAEAELAAHGITTAVLAQFLSWEGGMRGAGFAARMLDALDAVRAEVATDLRVQLRLEVTAFEDYPALEEMVARHGVGHVVFNDHLPHDALARAARPPRLTGQALKAGRSPEAHQALLQELHGRMPEVPDRLAALAARLRAQGVRLGSHDDATAEDRRAAHALGAHIAEFPETVAAARAARAQGDAVIMGAPNLVRGGSHKGNAGARAMVALGLVDALASDYHAPSLARAAFCLVDEGICDLVAAWALVSSGPARIMGLADRGTLAEGSRADLVVIERATRRIGATIAGGRISYLTGVAAARFLG
ncbi:alpha-D-ribose 1-methylphosphonate 5-triphosphate diphosphatase [Roseovarius autotrophicus]|uniref:alpha-D-ribose 1-methylphosphonate 5-triphosphate diphosphatase n=1 Tax=Roseovarius autotrophicus TaxID=2824121 RepID=UPI0019E273D9|nr:alpha-D-ribose 1-methylphosphonate 5-triphosphate diphosphatase [Roseovarius autotrophicus]MBE0455460.1 alpha-D-ribose 1-methylphosphonate 5-triphosphate diphosphatase [Roseovarius sp.]